MVSLALSMTCHNTDVHFPVDGGSIKVGAWSFVDLPGSSRMHATFGDPRRETFHKLLQPFHDEVLLGARRPLGPTTTFCVEPGILLLTSIENRLYKLVESGDMSENGGDKVRDIDPKGWEEFFSQHIIDLLSVLGCVCKAARVEGPRRLLERGCK